MYRSPQNGPCKYVADLPPSVLFSLQDILDIQDNWKYLAAQLGYTTIAIERFRRQGYSAHESSPTRFLILDWLNQRPTVVELYGALLQVEMISASEVLHNYVPHEVINHVQEPPAYQPQIVPSYSRSNNYSHQPPQCGANDIPMPTPPTQGNIQYQNEGCMGLQENYQRAKNYSTDGYFPGKHPGNNYNRGSPVETTNRRSGVDINYDFQRKTESRDMNMNDLANNKPKQCDAQKPMESFQTPPTPSHAEATPTLDPRNRIVKSKTLITAVTFNYHDIQEGTNNFNEKNILGEGGFGIVYRAVLKGTVCAVKLLKEFDRPEDEHETMESNLTEIASLFIYRHSNIIGLTGYSVYGPKTCIVYEFMANGSLEDRLRCKGSSPPLSWQLRHRIMMGAARGLQYLHTAQAKPLIHGDIKSANILLDQNMEAKLSDFGQARQATGSTNTGQFTHVTKEVLQDCPIYGTRAYLPIDFFQDCKLSISTDTFSFGVVIFEVCTGQMALDPNRGSRDTFLRDYIRDKYDDSGLEILLKEMDNLAQDWPSHMFSAILQVGVDCTEKRKKKRPEMTKVLSTLECLDAEIQIQGRRFSPIGASDQSQSSNDSNNTHRSCPPMSHRIHYDSGQHPEFKVNFQPPSLSPPCSLGGSKSYQTISSGAQPPDGSSDPAEDPRYLDYNLEKLTRSERISEQKRQEDLSLSAAMCGLRVGPQSLPPPSLSIGSHVECKSVPMQLQMMYDQRSSSFSTSGGNPLQDVRVQSQSERHEQVDEFSQPSIGAGIPEQHVSESSSQSSTEPTVMASLEHHVELRSKKKEKKAFPFLSGMEEYNTKSEHLPSQQVEVDGYDIEGGVWSPPSSGVQEGPHQSDCTYGVNQPRPECQQRVEAPAPLEAANPSLAVPSFEGYHPGRVSVPTAVSLGDIARFQHVQKTQRSFEPPDSGSIHSSDLYCGLPHIDIADQSRKDFSPIPPELCSGEAIPSSSSSNPEDQQRIARGLELLKRHKKLEIKET